MAILSMHIRAAIAINNSLAYIDSVGAVTTILVHKRFMTEAQAAVCTEESFRSSKSDGVTFDRLNNTEDNMINLINVMMWPELNRHQRLADHYVDTGRLN
ncbi:MAG: hypothetical protein ABI716_00255 [Candidatus Saccharibacteria bacterium]